MADVSAKPGGDARAIPRRLVLAVTALLTFAPAAEADLFAPRVDFPAGQDPSFLATGDFNRDGDQRVTDTARLTVLRRRA